jgi:hypothetical protein
MKTPSVYTIVELRSKFYRSCVVLGFVTMYFLIKVLFSRFPKLTGPNRSK